MKLDFYISSLSGGGAEKVLTTLAEEFAGRGNTVSILSLEKRPQFYSVSDNVGLEKVNNKGKGWFAEILLDFVAVRRRIKKQNADVSISFLSRCNLLVILASRLTNRKIIVCDRNNPLMEHSKRVFKHSCKMYSKADAVFVQTEEIKSFYPEYLQSKIYVIENPIDFDSMKNQLAHESIEKENAIISIGRLEKQKDFLTLIKAFSIASPTYPQWKLKIFGNGDMKEELQELAKELGIEDKVLFCGRTDRPFLELMKAEIFVLSSNYEGFPNALCEGMACGLACVSSNCVSGPSELIENGKNGYLFEVGNYEELADRLTELMGSKEKRAALGKEAELSIQCLELSSVADKWLSIIDKI